MKVVRDVMSECICFLGSDNTLADAVALMTEQLISSVLICESDTPIGIVTERDIVSALSEQLGSNDLPKMPLADLMSPSPICIDESLDLSDAIALARSRRIRHLPVVDAKGKAVGMVTQSDVVNAYVDALESLFDLEKDNEVLKLLSLTDSLVSAGNRRAFEAELKHVEADYQRYGRSFSIAMVDVDCFKAYNDHYGHEKGDTALIRIVDTINENKRDVDRLFRYGGEEFALIMPNTSVEQARCVAERICQAVYSRHYPHSKSVFDRVTISIGVAERLDSQANVVELADNALYDAKNSGRNQVKVINLTH